MGDHLIPDGMMALDPPISNFFENIVLVQFNHRLLAMLVLGIAVWLWVRALRSTLPQRTQFAFHTLLGVVLAQVTLGIVTLLLIIPVPIAAAHQAGALVLFTVSLWVVHELGGTKQVSKSISA